jgi:PIN domain nuclease of toxin-antitoxin system
LPTAGPLLSDRGRKTAEEGFKELPIGIRDGKSARNLPLLHRDPFDRMLIAQALGRNLMLVSNKAAFDQYGVLRLW